MFFDKKKYFKYIKIVGIALASLESYFRNESNDTNNVQYNQHLNVDLERISPASSPTSPALQFSPVLVFLAGP
jgi:hypothetical protein